MEETRNLITRIATAVVAVPILLLIFYHGGVYYLAFMCVLGALCSLEFFALAGPGYTEVEKDLYHGHLSASDHKRVF